MGFLDRFDPRERARFEDASSLVHVDPGQWLVRRGEPGGDIYVLEEGTLEVVDPGAGLDAIMAVLEPGAVVGEVSFLDDAPRTADVRARSKSRVRRWAREDVRALLVQEPTLAVRFLDGLARTVARRLRELSFVTRGASRGSSGGDTVDQLLSDVTATVDVAKELLDRADVALRQRPHDPDAVRTAHLAMERLQADLHDAFGDTPTGEPAKRAMRFLRRELRPWIARSHIGEACLREFGEVIVSPELVDHVLRDVARGEGPLGSQLDRWLLDRPTFAARRATEQLLAPTLHAGLPDRPRRVALLDTPAPTRLDALASALADQELDLTVLDASRGALTSALAHLRDRPGLRVHAVQESPVRLALGRSKEVLPPHDAMILGDLPSYLPDRIVLPLLTYARTIVRPGGRILLMGMDETQDETLNARLLLWPRVRRSIASLRRLAERAGLTVLDELTEDPRGHLLVLRHPITR